MRVNKNDYIPPARDVVVIFVSVFIIAGIIAYGK